MSAQKAVLLAAGGTGGHLFPAEAVAAVLAGRGTLVDLVTDARMKALGGHFPARRVTLVPSATIKSRKPADMVGSLARLGAGYAASLALLMRERPAVVVGFGGYPTLPPLVAAVTLGVPTIVHEANAVLGRANRFMSRFATVATAFPEVKGLAARERRTVHTGLPVRPAVIAAATRPYREADPADDFRLLVFGGSQGARIFADIVPPAMAELPEDRRARLVLTQQCRPEDMERARGALASAGVRHEIAPFFPDLPRRMAEAHLVVSRAGASTIAELATIGRPAVLVPLPGALDQDQSHNADAMGALGGAWHVPQADFTPARLAAEIVRLMDDPDALAIAAVQARGLAQTEAAERLADLIERIVDGRMPAGGPRTAVIA